uniref:Uncharacterized protein n=1 Tax=Arundo donax TaxID=35708 RepID=A0A0A8ZRQ3_ARUDO
MNTMEAHKQQALDIQQQTRFKKAMLDGRCAET